MSSSSSPSPLISLTAGAIAGGAECFITYPTEYIKTRKQLGSSRSSPFRILADAIKTSGFRVLYTGAGAFCISNASKSAVRFFTFDTIRSRLPRNTETGKPTAVSTMMAGVGAGVAEAITVVTPGESIKTRIISDRAGPRQLGSTADAVGSILAADGPKGLYRGVVPVTLKQGSNALVRFTSYSFLMDNMVKPRLDGTSWSSLAPAIAGSSAGVITVYATMPFDVIKTKMQVSAAGASKQSTLEWTRSIVQDVGVSGLWKGTTPRLMRLSISGALSFTIYQNVVQIMQSSRPDSRRKVEEAVGA